MTKITYGKGTVLTQQASIEGEGKAIIIKDTGIARPIGSTLKEWDKQTPQEDCDVILVFTNIEGARSLQDELNELISVWGREMNPKV